MQRNVRALLARLTAVFRRLIPSLKAREWIVDDGAQRVCVVLGRRLWSTNEMSDGAFGAHQEGLPRADAKLRHQAETFEADLLSDLLR